LNTPYGGINELERLNHVHAPIEGQIHLGRAAAGNGADIFKTRHAIDSVFERTGDGHFHLVDGHDTVIHANDNPWKVSRWKHSDRDRKRFVDSHHRQHTNEKNNRFRMAGEPVALLLLCSRHCRIFGLSHEKAPVAMATQIQ
jgi:hypothetical protein